MVRRVREHEMRLRRQHNRKNGQAEEAWDLGNGMRERECKAHSDGGMGNGGVARLSVAGRESKREGAMLPGIKGV